MSENELIPHLFRTEYSKIIAVLCKHFGVDHIETAEDIASDTFLSATQTWGLKGLPDNPVGWLYTVARNKARNILKHEAVFQRKVAGHLKQADGQQMEIPMPEKGKAKISRDRNGISRRDRTGHSPGDGMQDPIPPFQ